MSDWVEQAARVTDPVKHSSLLARYGLSVVALIGGTAAALLAVPTMGGSLALMAATVAATVAADEAGIAIGRAELQADIADRVMERDTGETIEEGAATVFLDEIRERAAKADPATTLSHGGHWVSWGSRTVFIENTYASRFGDHTSCGGHICYGSETVFYGGEKTPYPGVSDNPREQHPLDEEFFAISLAVGLAAAARIALARTATTQLRGTTPGTIQGLSHSEVRAASAIARDGAGHYSDDIAVHGSRAAGTARPTSDLDVAVRVPPDQFDDIVAQRFRTPNPGSAKERTMLHAMQSGKIQAGEAGLRGTRRAMERALGMEVDLSVIRIGGPFDNGPYIPLR